MSGYNNHSFIISIDTIAKYWKCTALFTVLVLLLLKPTNPIFKIALALHVGLQTMLFLVYSPLVYYQRLSADDIEGNNSTSGGLLQKITNFIPSMMYKISTLFLQIIMYIFTSNSNYSKKFNLHYLAAVMTYFLIAFRKLLALSIHSYTSIEDDESTHIKSYALFCIFTLIQMRFILNLNSTEKTVGSTRVFGNKLSLFEGLKVILSLSTHQNSKSQPNRIALIQLARSRLCALAVFINILSVYIANNSITGSNGDSIIWIGGMKLLLIVDTIFVSSFIVELTGLNLYFANEENSIV